MSEVPLDTIFSNGRMRSSSESPGQNLALTVVCAIFAQQWLIILFEWQDALELAVSICQRQASVIVGA